MRLQDENASFRINQSGLQKFLGDLECEIMELVWKLANPTTTVRDVFDALKVKRDIAYTTVMTTMVRLSEKELLKIVDKAGLANVYVPRYNREQFVEEAIKQIMRSLSDEYPREVLNFMEANEARITKKASKRR
ncbi:MAG: BlaI/MecI/CopY family transcriptional regulator [Candidatus Melainabacteria bacterium]|jgi:predicted transcriptional regulator|uniref:BlaI/MecI/CopY family transcriptional regulator n=1 Tax=Candidatus Obscuribacter phosphatis TaxID=1906157 RepID=A0A8J7TK23_9BACT|nr:BlaI/MecI/CopY family transcriptional regulator [Candidatus Obscuribacter phosphatis]MCA0313575.1 BlaI/MecI/CopY family transcriptional regulator [Candidatus Melainabacteria bacterium]